MLIISKGRDYAEDSVRCRWKMTRTNPFNEKVANTETDKKRLEKEREVKLY